MSLVLGRFVSTLEHGHFVNLLIAVLKLPLEIVEWIVTNRLLYDLLRFLSGRLLPIIW